MKQVSNEEFCRILKERYPELAKNYPNLDQIICQLGGSDHWDFSTDDSGNVFHFGKRKKD